MADEQSARLEAVTDHGGDVRSLFVRPTRPFAFAPGQFVSCLLPVGGQRLTRPYSIASDPETPERLELLLNLVPGGPGSHHLFSLQPGAEIVLTGPWGTFVVEPQDSAEAIFIADGTGIAPIRPMLRQALASGRRPVTLLHAASAPMPHVYGDEHAALAAADEHLTFERLESAALLGEVERRWVHADDDRSRHFFICGVGDVVVRLRHLLRGAGYERRAVRYEKW
jgi:ferredoxin-NADP reductase